ncbi:MAG: helicase [Spirochaetes bacterium GWB1_59_5]|nr:MAG: helicase [Spirochaetes bacterium GWB1_59_5]
MAPTGSGKTILALHIIHQTLVKGNRCLFICDRKNLINQTSAVADKLGLTAHGILQAGHWRTNRRMPFQIASVQTLQRRGIPDDFDVVVVDEAHTQYGKIMEHIKNCRARVIGLSATPFSAGLGNIYTNLVNAATMHELTEAGILVPMRIFSCTKVDMAGAETRGGEWTDKAAETRGMEIVGNVVEEWIKFAVTRKTIVFGPTIAHCREMASKFNEAGYRAEVFCADTGDEEREVILKEFEKTDSAIRLLVSVEALAKGFDVPDVECVCDVRPLRKSLSTAIQMWGRGLRSCEATGKTECILLDFSGNIIRFAEDFSDIFFNGLDALDMGEKLDKAIRRDEEKEPAKCPKCGYSPCGKRCVQCGHEIKPPPSTVEVHAGQMKEIMLGGKKLADDARHLYEQVCTYTRGNGNPDTASQRAYYLFRDMTGGQVPPRSWHFDQVPNTPITRNVANKITALRIAWIKRKS